ncbi:MAG: putative zinc-binding metallopeptidase [Polyangiaceae bacterium]
MKVFVCSICGNPLFFENFRCMQCGCSLAYLPEPAVLSPIEPAPDRRQDAAGSLEGVFVAKAPCAQGRFFRLCKNGIDHAACNWAVPVEDGNPLCRACRLNEVIPDLSNSSYKEDWQRIERAKRRLIYSLLELGLPLESRLERPKGGLGFSFKAERPSGPKILTGHDAGLITINVAEADDPVREKMRTQMGEPYRTVLGHFRHEIGHYYWDRLIRDSEALAPFRDTFGDERTSYEASLERHYRDGAPPNWPLDYVSAYASMHPWEDWAETWAHVLHMVDTLDTARAYGLALRPEFGRAADDLTVATRKLDFGIFDQLLEGWVPVTVALNSLNRSMGMPDLYPFVLSERVIRKLRFVHETIHRARQPGATRAPSA